MESHNGILPTYLVLQENLPNLTTSNQGNFQTCTRHALAKAIVQGFMLGIFQVLANLSDPSLDLSQEAVTTLLYEAMGSVVAMWPYDFNGITLSPLSEISIVRVWDITLKDIKEVSKMTFVQDMLNEPQPTFMYVLVYEVEGTPTDPDLHCVFADEMKANESREYDSVHCINSHKAYPDLLIKISRQDLRIFQVNCVAKPTTKHLEVTEKVVAASLETPVASSNSNLDDIDLNSGAAAMESETGKTVDPKKKKKVHFSTKSIQKSVQKFLKKK